MDMVNTNRWKKTLRSVLPSSLYASYVANKLNQRIDHDLCSLRPIHSPFDQVSDLFGRVDAGWGGMRAGVGCGGGGRGCQSVPPLFLSVVLCPLLCLSVPSVPSVLGFLLCLSVPSVPSVLGFLLCLSVPSVPSVSGCLSVCVYPSVCVPFSFSVCLSVSVFLSASVLLFVYLCLLLSSSSYYYSVLLLSYCVLSRWSRYPIEFEEDNHLA